MATDWHFSEETPVCIRHVWGQGRSSAAQSLSLVPSASWSAGVRGYEGPPWEALWLFSQWGLPWPWAVTSACPLWGGLGTAPRLVLCLFPSPWPKVWGTYRNCPGNTC